MATLATQDQINNNILSQSAAGVPTTAIIDSLNTNAYKKEIVYKELDKISVEITDRDNLSRNYLRLTYLPDEFRLGKNLIKIRPDVSIFEQNTYLYVEIIDYNGDPIYYEAEINSDSDDNFIIISVYIYEDTCPGPCAVYILGTLKDYEVPNDGRLYPVNFRWEQIINIDTTEKTTSPIIYTKSPSITLISNTSSYDILGFSGDSPYTASNYTNLYLYNGFLNPCITPLNELDIFKPSMEKGELRGKFSDVVLKSPAGLKTYPTETGFTASISTYINDKSMQLDQPIVIYQYKAEPIVIESATISNATISFEQSESIITQRDFKKRILTVQFDDLDPFVGQVRNIKTSIRDNALKNTEYLLLSDFEVPSTGVNKGFSPDSSKFSIVLPDSYVDQYYDIKFEFYNNETIPAINSLELYGILVDAAPPNNIVVNNENNSLDTINLVRTLWQDYDTRCVHTSSNLLQSGESAVSKSITQFSAFIPDGSPYITTFYNASFINLAQKTGIDKGIYSYNTVLSAYEIATSSYANFAFDIDELQASPVYTSQASIILNSGQNAGHTAFANPVKHVAKLPRTNRMYRFKLDHNLSVPYSASLTGITFDKLSNSSNWDTSLLPGQVTIGSGTASISLNAGTNGYIYQTLSTPLISGENYKIGFNVTEYTAPGDDDYISLGLETVPDTNISVATISTTGKIEDAGRYEYILQPGIFTDVVYFYFNTSIGTGNPILNTYKINPSYGYSNVVVADGTPLTDLSYLTILNTDPKISLNSSNRFKANTSGRYVFNYNFTATGSCVSTVDISPAFIKYNSAGSVQSTTYLETMSTTLTGEYKSYNGDIGFDMSTGDYIKLIFYGSDSFLNTLNFDANGNISYVDSAPATNVSKFKIENISLERLISVQASFEASCSIKDVDIVSSGYKFVSHSRGTQISGAYDYYVPVS